MTVRKTRIVVADDHTLLREALCDLLGTEPEFEIVGQAGSGTAAVRVVAERRPHVVLLDVEMPDNEPCETVRRLLGLDPDLRIVVLSMHDSPQLVQELLSCGVRGYVHKGVERSTLVSAIRQCVTGDQSTVTVSISPQSLATYATPWPDDCGLSHREREVLALVAEALGNRQISAQLGITEGTVKRHLRNIFTKLDAASRIDAVNRAAQRGLIPRRRLYPSVRKVSPTPEGRQARPRGHEAVP